MTTPSTLPCVNTSNCSWDNHGFEYRLRSETSTYAVYDVYDTDKTPTPDWNNTGDDYSIKITFADKDNSMSGWSDNSTSGPPTTLTVNGLNMQLYSGSELLYEFVIPTSASWIGGGTGTEGVNAPFVTWYFPHRACGSSTYVGVTHTAATSSATTYTVHDETGQIGTILVGTGATATANYSFTISARTLTVKDASGSVLSSRVFDCNSRKVFCNFW